MSIQLNGTHFAFGGIDADGHVVELKPLPEPFAPGFFPQPTELDAERSFILSVDDLQMSFEFELTAEGMEFFERVHRRWLARYFVAPILYRVQPPRGRIVRFGSHHLLK